MNRLIQMVVAMGMLLTGPSQGPARPEVPESLKAPAGEEVILVAHATGTQIYVCQAGADQKFAWVFKAPEAELTDATGKKIAHHFAGPTWKRRVTSIQRIHTEGGMPPEAKSCDGSNAGKEVGTAYAADYYFYAPAH